MPTTRHIEQHFDASDTVRDVVIGMSDGLTVPFALAAGLSGAVASSGVVVTAGLAEVAAGAIAMGLGGFLAARTDAEHYRSEYRRELRETQTMPDEERSEVTAIFRDAGLSGATLAAATDAIASDRDRWIDFMMRYELGLEKPDPRRAPVSALTIGGSYALGGLVPLAPYMIVPGLSDAFRLSVALTILALLIFGAVKGRLTGAKPWLAALQTAVIGTLAAGAAFVIAKWVGA